jgi:hypothetical protein
LVDGETKSGRRPVLVVVLPGLPIVNVPLTACVAAWGS